MTTVRETIGHDWEASTESGRLALATIAQYEGQASGMIGDKTSAAALSAGLLTLTELEIQTSYWASILSESAETGFRGTGGAREAKAFALDAWFKTLKDLESADSDTTIDSNAFRILCASLVSAAS